MATRNIIRKLTKSEAARIGGLARQKMYGDIGTPEGRARGGRNSLVTHRRLHTRFKQLRKVRFPKASNLLAEFIGVVMGDGHVGRYQISICTNSITDTEHATYIYKIAKTLFDAPITLSKKRDSNALSITISSREVSRFLQLQGVPEGDKIKKGITIPAWVTRRSNYSQRLMRGLFDSDGCVFVDTHRIRGKTYKNLGIAFANQEPTVLKLESNTRKSLARQLHLHHMNGMVPFRYSWLRPRPRKGANLCSALEQSPSGFPQRSKMRFVQKADLSD